MIVSKTFPSRGAMALVRALRDAGERVIVSSRRVFPRARLVINWGAASPLTTRGEVLNAPRAVDVARNKLSTFRALSTLTGVNVPKYWTNKEEAERERTSIMVERHSLTGSQGQGIVIKREGEALSPCPLYVGYIPKHREYRVHVFDGQAIAVQQKRKADNPSIPTSLIRNHANGYVFCINNVNDEGLDDVKAMAVAAVKGMGLTFGGVDMVVGKDDNKPYVLEINTAPGLESNTVINAYVQAIRSKYAGR